MHQLKQRIAQNADLTPDVIAQVDNTIRKHKGKPGCLITVLTECQAIVRYLPIELQEYISKGLDIPESTIYGVVTFYSFFTMTPKGKHMIKICTGTACYVRGIAEVESRICNQYKIKEGQTSEDRRFSLAAVRCLGACGLAPVVVVDEDTHGGVSADRIIDILESYE